MQILLAEDEHYLAEGIKIVLEKKGHNVFLAHNGKEAQQLLNKEEIDVVITDIIMPEMDGIELMNLVNEQFPSISIIAISGGGRIDASDHLRAAKKIGAKSILKKPFSMIDLIDAIEK